MQLSDAFLTLGEQAFGSLVRQISIGKLRTYQLYDRMKTRAHVAKLNTEALRKGVPRFWTRLQQRDEDFAQDLAQSVLVSHLDLIVAVLDSLGIPHEGGFFAKGLDANQYLKEGWPQRVYDQFRDRFPAPPLLFYINHLLWEMAKAPEPFVPEQA